MKIGQIMHYLEFMKPDKQGQIIYVDKNGVEHYIGQAAYFYKENVLVLKERRNDKTDSNSPVSENTVTP